MAPAYSSETPFFRAIDHSVDLLAMHDAWPTRYPFLLESADGASKISRYDLLLHASDEYLCLEKTTGLQGNCSTFDPELGFLENLGLWQKHAGNTNGKAPQLFNGGWFIYLGYELVAEIEPSLQLPVSPGSLPVALAVRCPAAIIHDRQENQYWAVAETAEQLDIILQDCFADPPGIDRIRGTVSVTNMIEASDNDFIHAVATIKEYIIAGDVFQVNLSRAWEGEVPEGTHSADLYQQLREANPAPFAGLMHWQGTTLFSSSPERLVETRGRRIQTRPIAGTRPRNHHTISDEDERSDLVTHPKERAEHIMLIDLERNDLGRICEPGSIEVDELMVLESYAHVHHIVSNVCGILRNDVTANDVIKAVFPGGTITGCPKVRCMEIIAELERVGRSYYTGAMGYLDINGDMDLNILIRCLEREGSTIRFRTGAGIVADSVADNELQETRAKARGLLSALNAH